MPYNPGNQFTQTSGYGWRTNPVTGQSEYHGGVDFAAPVGTDIPAASSGVVWYSGLNSSYGNTVIIQSTGPDGQSFYTLYAHMNGADMPAVGNWVNQGDTIGQVGLTGATTGPHVHFEVLNGDAPICSADGGPIGVRSSDPSVRTDPTTFNNWNTWITTTEGSSSWSPNILFSPTDNSNIVLDASSFNSATTVTTGTASIDGYSYVTANLPNTAQSTNLSVDQIIQSQQGIENNFFRLDTPNSLGSSPFGQTNSGTSGSLGDYLKNSLATAELQDHPPIDSLQQYASDKSSTPSETTDAAIANGDPFTQAATAYASNAEVTQGTLQLMEGLSGNPDTTVTAEQAFQTEQAVQQNFFSPPDAAQTLTAASFDNAQIVNTSYASIGDYSYLAVDTSTTSNGGGPAGAGDALTSAVRGLHSKPGGCCVLRDDEQRNEPARLT